MKQIKAKSKKKKSLHLGLVLKSKTIFLSLGSRYTGGDWNSNFWSHRMSTTTKNFGTSNSILFVHLSSSVEKKN